MTRNEFDMLYGRIMVLENLVFKLIDAQPNGAEIVRKFEADTAQQIAMQAANGSPPELIDALRTALETLRPFVYTPPPA